MTQDAAAKREDTWKIVYPSTIAFSFGKTLGVVVCMRAQMITTPTKASFGRQSGSESSESVFQILCRQRSLQMHIRRRKFQPGCSGPIMLEELIMGHLRPAKQASSSREDRIARGCNAADHWCALFEKNRGAEWFGHNWPCAAPYQGTHGSLRLCCDALTRVVGVAKVSLDAQSNEMLTVQTRSW